MKKRIPIKLLIFITILLLVFIIFLFFIFKSYNYTVTYNINDIKIEEEYNKKDKYYTFLITKNKITYPFLIRSKYLRHRKLINDILVKENDNEVCLYPQSKRIDFYPICSNDKDIVAYNLANNKDIDYTFKGVNKNIFEYEKIKSYNINNANYLIYNYKGFYFINKDNKFNIELFNKDNYNINLYYIYKDYVIIPDYNDDHYFKRLYAVNNNTGKVITIDSEYDISYDSIFLGDYKKKIYLLDKKERKEYVILFNKKKVEETEFKNIKNGKLVNESYSKIVNNYKGITNKNIFKYEVINNKLYKVIDNIKIKLSDNYVDKIISNKEEVIYYLVKENLYMYSEDTGEVL